MMFALADVNSMYASCEQIFRPDLDNRAVVVTSNNDGNIVARNRLAKQAGLKMGEPIFKVQHLIKQHEVVVFSSNYSLYADMSARFVATVESLSARVEQYSIDELFIECAGMGKAMSYDEFGHQLRDTVYRATGLTIGVGFGPSKTLAKIANYAAKTWSKTGGVVVLDDAARRYKLLSLLPVSEVWGVGRQLTKKLTVMGYKTALDLALADTKFIRKNFGVVLERTVRELRGEPCLSLEEHPPTKQQIISSRSFGRRVTELVDMQQAICGHASIAASKLRQEKQYCKAISVFIRTSPFSHDAQYSNQFCETRITPTQDTRDIVEAAQRALLRIWRPGIRYAKAGIMLADFSGREAQLALFDEAPPRPNSEKLMAVMDRLNKDARGTLFLAGQGINTGFQMKRQWLSPAYTTRWSDLPKFKVR